jgi:hypothetical protein
MLCEFLLMLRELLLMLGELYLGSWFVLAMGVQEHPDRFGQGFVALNQPVEPLVDAHNYTVQSPQAGSPVGTRLPTPVFQKTLGLVRKRSIVAVVEFPLLSVTVSRKTKSRFSGNRTISGVAVFWPRMVAWLL